MSYIRTIEGRGDAPMRETKMTNQTATVAQVRKSYKDAGHTVRIGRDGHVTFKRNGEGEWLEGRWVDEYLVDAELGVHLR